MLTKESLKLHGVVFYLDELHLLPGHNCSTQFKSVCPVILRKVSLLRIERLFIASLVIYFTLRTSPALTNQSGITLYRL